MPLPLAASLTLAEVGRFVSETTGEADKRRVADALVNAGASGAIQATGRRHASAHPKLQQYFAHPVLYDRENVPAAYWSVGPIDWQLSRIARYDEVRIERAEIQRWLGASSATGPAAQEAGANVPRRDATVAPADEKVISIQTGLPGKPTSWHLIEAECRRRYEAGEQHDAKAEWARQLRAWIVSRHPGMSPPTEKTIANRLTELLRELRNSPK